MRSTKPNRCKHCRERMPEDKARHVLHEQCMDAWIAGQQAKQQRKREADRRARAKVERADIKRRKEESKTLPELIKEADRAFSDFIRARDRLAGHACISSGRPLEWSGNEVDAGHYRSRGAASHLRYHEDNCHAQSKQDNRYLAGNAVEYRIRLIARIGVERVEALEADNRVCKWTHDQLRGIRNTYRQKLKDLEASR